jgi:hypothetical protein
MSGLENLLTAQLVSSGVGAAVPLIGGLFGPSQRTPSWNTVPVPNFESQIAGLNASLDPTKRDRIFSLASDRVSEQMARQLARQGMGGSSAGMSATGSALAELNDKFIQNEIQNRIAVAQQVANMKNIAARVALANSQGQYGADQYGFQTGMNARSGFLGGLGKTAGALAGLYMMQGMGAEDAKEDFSKRNKTGNDTTNKAAGYSDPALDRALNPNNPGYFQVGVPTSTRSFFDIDELARQQRGMVFPGDPTINIRGY